MGPTWVLSAPDGPHIGSMNLAIWEVDYGAYDRDGLVQKQRNSIVYAGGNFTNGLWAHNWSLVKVFV